MARPSYEELKRKLAITELKLKEAEDAMKEANRSLRRYNDVGTWVAFPIPEALHVALISKMEEVGVDKFFQAEEFTKTLPDGRKENTFEDCDGLLTPNFRHYICHYEYTREDGAGNFRLFGLAPV